MARLTLAHPVFLAGDATERAAQSPYFPLGLLYLAGYVREAGHTVTIFDGTFAEGPSDFVEHIEVHRPDLVGISALLTSRDSALSLAALGAATGAAVVLGGPDPTHDPGSYLSDESVDVVVHHEGEETMTRLLDLIDSNELSLDHLVDEPGIALRVDGRVTINRPRPPIENLDQLPLPARDLIDMDRYLHQWEQSSGYSSITVSTSRGCPFGCEWCRDAVHGDGFRQRSPENVAAEIEALKSRYAPESIRLVDDVDGMNRGWLEDWATSLESRDAAIPFEPLNRIDRTDLPLLEVRDSL